MHARILSRALWAGDIVESNVDAIGVMLGLTTEAEVKLRVELGQARWAAHVALGREPSIGFPAKRRRRPGGTVRDFNDLRFEAGHAERQIELMIRKDKPAAARDWHNRLLGLTALLNTLPVNDPTDAGHLLDDIWRRAKQYHSTPARKLRVVCRDTSVTLWTSGTRKGMRAALSKLLPIAKQLDNEADAALHQDLLKVIARLKF